MISDRVVLLGEGPGVCGFDELDRADRARGTGMPALGRCLAGEPAGDRPVAVLPPRGADWC